MNLRRFNRVHILRLIILLIFALFPLSGNDYLTVQLTQYMVYGIFAMSLSLLWDMRDPVLRARHLFRDRGLRDGPHNKGPDAGITSFLASPGSACCWPCSAWPSLRSFWATSFSTEGLSGPYLGIVTLAISVILERWR